MRVTVVTAGAALAALLTGCGGDDSSTDLSTPQAMAQALGCTYVADSTQEIFVKEVGKCQLGDREVRLLTFANEDGCKGFIKVATTFGGVYVYGSKWAVEAGDSATAGNVKDKLGGTIA